MDAPICLACQSKLLIKILQNDFQVKVYLSKIATKKKRKGNYKLTTN